MVLNRAQFFGDYIITKNLHEITYHTVSYSKRLLIAFPLQAIVFKICLEQHPFSPKRTPARHVEHGAYMCASTCVM